MRKLTAGNKTNFTIFAIIIILIIALLIFCLSRVLNTDKQIYQIDSGTFFYDKDNNPIKLEDEASLQAKWDGNYYLQDASKQKYNMGGQVVAYKTTTAQTTIYGKAYKIQTDGNVEKVSGETKISNYREDNFYKLEDRKYLITSSRIYNETETLNTKNYLIVIIDKAGNAYLLNNEIDSKIISPIKIKTDTFVFDVANEKLTCEDKDIDLKRVLGSTNMYEEKKNNVIEEVKTADNTSNTIINTNPPIYNNSSTINNNNINSTNNSTTTIISGGTNTSTDDKNKTELAKSVSLRSITPTSSTLTVQYNIQDPEDKYQTVYLTIDGDVGRNISLDKSANQYIITGLSPNTEYSVKLNSRELDENGEAVETIEDLVNVRTTDIQAYIAITKVTLNQIYFNLKLDTNYAFDTCDVALYVDGKREEIFKKVDINEACSQDGFTGSFKYKYGSIIEVKLENVRYNEKSINTNISTKIKNY